MTSRPETAGKLPLTDLVDMKRRRDPIVMVTAYDFPGGRIADAAGVDIVLVGDSAAMTVLGNESTVPATMDEMVMLTRAVARGARRPLVVADMPFGSFQVSDEEAVRNGVHFLKEAGADAVKVEGAGSTVSRVLALVGAGIPVMGHIGLTPQSATMLGGFRAQGRTAAKARELLEDARTLEHAGCFAVVLEAVPAPVAARITEALSIVVWPVRLALYGEDSFRSGGSDSGAGVALFDGLHAAFAIWAGGLLVYGISVVERWKLLRAAVSIALMLLTVLIVTLPFLIPLSSR